jgi:AcrR family transcriptional regulator
MEASPGVKDKPDPGLTSGSGSGTTVNGKGRSLRPAPGAQTLRGHFRQNLILKVAAELFAEYGFDRVSINDIGEAAEITGPAIYRYFSSKEELLVSIYERVYNRNKEAVATLLAKESSASDLLRGLVDHQILIATEEPEKIRIIDAEERQLPLEAAESLRVERTRLLKVWRDVVREARPDLRPDEAELTLHAVLALINSISLRKSNDPIPERLSRRLRNMALALLLDLPVSGDSDGSIGDSEEASSK